MDTYDGTIHTPAHHDESAIRYGIWTYGKDSYGSYTASRALYAAGPITSDKMEESIRFVRKALRRNMIADGSVGKGYRIKLSWQIDIDETTPRPTTIMRIWES